MSQTLENSLGAINKTNALQFGQWIGNRYPGLPKLLIADINPLWVNKTAYIENYGKASAPSLVDHRPVYDLLAQGLINGEIKAGIDQASTPAIITAHLTNQWFDQGPIAIASAFFNDRTWFTFDSSQTGHTNVAPHLHMQWWNAEQPYEAVQAMYRNPTTRPIVDNEAHYENRFINGKSGARSKVVWNATSVRIGTIQSVSAAKPPCSVTAIIEGGPLLTPNRYFQELQA
jgi:hypothetical protein